MRKKKKFEDFNFKYLLISSQSFSSISSEYNLNAIQIKLQSYRTFSLKKCIHKKLPEKSIGFIHQLLEMKFIRKSSFEIPIELNKLRVKDKRMKWTTVCRLEYKMSFFFYFSDTKKNLWKEKETMHFNVRTIFA
jgi:hypothetical protein